MPAPAISTSAAGRASGPGTSGTQSAGGWFSLASPRASDASSRGQPRPFRR